MARLLGEYHVVRRVLLTDSGTAALTEAMRAAMTYTGRDSIALPAYCCYDLVTALNGAGARPILYDVDPETLGPDWMSFDAAVQTGPAAAVVAHLYGLPVDMPAAMEIAERWGVAVIEDAAQGAGAQLNGQPLGTFGDLRVLSFGRGKGQTAGRGGALLVAPSWRGQVREVLPSPRGRVELALLGAQWLLGRPSLYRIPSSLPFLGLGDTVYRAPRPAGGLSSVAAAVLEVTWRLRDAEAEVRRRNAAALLGALGEQEVLRAPRPIAGARPGWLRLPVVAKGLSRSDARMVRARTLGVLPGYPKPLSALAELPTPAWSDGAPGAVRLAESLWTLPTHSLVSEGDLDRLRGWIAPLKG